MFVFKWIILKIIRNPFSQFIFNLTRQRIILQNRIFKMNLLKLALEYSKLKFLIKILTNPFLFLFDNTDNGSNLNPTLFNLLLYLPPIIVTLLKLLIKSRNSKSCNIYWCYWYSSGLIDNANRHSVIIR